MAGPGIRCLIPGCPEPAVARCSYADRDGHVCGTTWCATHIVDIDGKAYCRRHAGIVPVIGHLDVAEWPPLASRAPSLVNWVAVDLADSASTVLGRCHSDGTEEVHQAAIARDGTTWSVAWRLERNGTVLHDISVAVDESEETVVNLRVDGVLALRSAPPWLERDRDELVPTWMDAMERQAYYTVMENVIARLLGVPLLTE